MATSCGMELREAAFAGLTQYVTQTTVDLLTNVSPLSQDDSASVAPEPDTGAGDDTNDPFDEPIQS